MSGDCCSLSSTELLVSFLPSPFRPSKTEYWSRKDVRRIGGRCARWSLSHFCTTCESGFSVILSSDMGTAFHRPPSKTASNQWWTPPFCLSLASFIALTSLCIHCSVSCGLKTLVRSHFQTANPPPPFVSSQNHPSLSYRHLSSIYCRVAWCPLHLPLRFPSFLFGFTFTLLNHLRARKWTRAWLTSHSTRGCLPLIWNPCSRSFRCV